MFEVFILQKLNSWDATLVNGINDVQEDAIYKGVVHYNICKWR